MTSHLLGTILWLSFIPCVQLLPYHNQAPLSTFQKCIRLTAWNWLVVLWWVFFWWASTLSLNVWVWVLPQVRYIFWKLVYSSSTFSTDIKDQRWYQILKSKWYTPIWIGVVRFCWKEYQKEYQVQQRQMKYVEIKWNYGFEKVRWYYFEKVRIFFFNLAINLIASWCT